MITLNQDLCEELDLVYWQANKSVDKTTNKLVLTITREEKELLRNVLLAKGVTLTESMLNIKPKGVVEIKLKKTSLIFNDSELSDTQGVLNLAKLSDMLSDKRFKKASWLKLKNTDLL